eukprot:TRINITY_DN11155_c1_g1_i6.p1 TRINITY_DN11155_c1_g1~~TRINITY_DN11155_c1_g1_i6.p1  ORF type:complete len:162 (-),score=23.42 TRINITY_DN11155_c1_g1_i6:467-952(-)
MMFMLAKLHARGQSGMGHRGMQQVAEAVFNALYTIRSCQIGDYKVQLHLVATMESLKREGDLLQQSHKEYLLEMLKEESDSVTLNAPHDLRDLLAQRSPSITGSILTDDGGRSTATNEDEDQSRAVESVTSLHSTNDSNASTGNSKSLRRFLGRIRKNQSL